MTQTLTVRELREYLTHLSDDDVVVCQVVDALTAFAVRDVVDGVLRLDEITRDDAVYWHGVSQLVRYSTRRITGAD